MRVDILERLADLIRPALSWKTGLGTRPDGAYDGSAFMVTPPMMSILGANADDIEEILKGLGYRAEPKPAAEVKARLEAIDQAAREAAAAAAAKAEARGEGGPRRTLRRRRTPKQAAEATSWRRSSADAASPLRGGVAEGDGGGWRKARRYRIGVSSGERPGATPTRSFGSPSPQGGGCRRRRAGATAEAAPLEAPVWAPEVDEAPVEVTPASSSAESADAPASPLAGRCRRRRRRRVAKKAKR